MTQKRVPICIPGYGKSYALLSTNTEADVAVVFVHGFAGKPTSTWIDFQGLVDEYSPDYPWWTISDLFFYGYNSLDVPIRRNAELLGSFVEKLWQDTWQGTAVSRS